jgi:hypothetical protein
VHTHERLGARADEAVDRERHAVGVAIGELVQQCAAVAIGGDARRRITRDHELLHPPGANRRNGSADDRLELFAAQRGRGEGRPRGSVFELSWLRALERKSISWGVMTPGSGLE